MQSGKIITNKETVRMEVSSKMLLFRVTTVIGILYILWRAVFTIDYVSDIRNTIAGIMLFSAELYTFVMFVAFSFVTSHKVNNISIDSSNNKDFFPDIDIFVCIYNENIDILRDTLIGCKNINYSNKKIYILDDGNRDEVRSVALELDCGYISREKNTGYKAGNINNALKYTDGELIAIFDADHIPASNFLDELVNFFRDEKVAVVQTPQNFFNSDPIQKNLKLHSLIANEQDLFFRIIEPNLNVWNATVIVGTNFLARRSAIEHIGGIPEDSLTEDMNLGLHLEAQKYKVIYYNKPLSAGLAPESFKEYVKQRIRWAKGTIQIFLNRKNKDIFKKLTFAQKTLYFAGFLYYFSVFSRLILLISPLLFLVFEIKPVIIKFWPIMFMFYVIYAGSKLLYFTKTLKQYRNIILSDIYETAIWFPVSTSIFRLLLKPSKFFRQTFYVTDKGNLEEKQVHFNLAIPNLAILTLCIVGMIFSIIHFKDIHYKEIACINLFWNTYNIIVLALSILISVENPDKRNSIRVPVARNGKLIINNQKTLNVEIKNLSKSGVLIEIKDDYADLSYLYRQKLALDLDRDLLNIPLKIVRISKKNDYIHIQASFLPESSQKSEDLLIGLMYKNSEAWG